MTRESVAELKAITGDVKSLKFKAKQSPNLKAKKLLKAKMSLIKPSISS